VLQSSYTASYLTLHFHQCCVLCRKLQSDTAASTATSQTESTATGAEETVQLEVGSATMQVENDMLKVKVQQLEYQLATARQVLTFEVLKRDPSVLQHYSGLQLDLFNVLFNMCNRFELAYDQGWNVQSVPKVDQLLMTLMKLKLNLTHTDLGYRFGASRTTVGNIVTSFIHCLHKVLFEGILVANGIPSVNKNKTCLPTCFSTFSNSRITLDCTEVQCAIPSQSMAHQRQTFSSYKQRNTFKGLVGVAPNGVITFVSKLYPGSTSDKAIVAASGVLDQMESGDMILADKGFVMQDLMPLGVSLNVPPFLKHGRFTKEEARLTTTIARARIHVERAIARIKNHSILSFIPAHYRTLSSKIFQVCACLVNMQAPILKEVSLDE